MFIIGKRLSTKVVLRLPRTGHASPVLARKKNRWKYLIRQSIRGAPRGKVFCETKYSVYMFLSPLNR